MCTTVDLTSLVVIDRFHCTIAFEHVELRVFVYFRMGENCCNVVGEILERPHMHL